MACWLLLVLFIFVAVNSIAVTHSESDNKTVEEGREAYYYVKVTNDDPQRIQGIDIRIDITQDISSFRAQNTEYHLDYGESKYTHIYVRTKSVKENEILTQIVILVREEGQDEYQEEASADFRTTIIHSLPKKDNDEFEERSNIFLAIGGFSLVGLIIYGLQSRKIITLPAMRGYTRLKPEKILENENRRKIFALINLNEEGLNLKEIRERTGISNPNLAEYHLKKLMYGNYVKKVDKRYYPNGVNTERPFVRKIEEAMEGGARTPGEVARRINSYREKVRYHMNKNGLK